MSLKDRIDGVEERIGEACRKSGRNRGRGEAGRGLEEVFR